MSATVHAATPPAVDAETRGALAELLLTMADDEFVIGYWDSEWTGIAPMLEEDVAFSSISQDEIGHARVLYELLGQLTGEDADTIAYGRQPDAYRHASLLNHARGDWAFTIARRYLYDTADAVRLEALASGSYAPLAQVVTKIRREETYHLMHMDAWVRRLASGPDDARSRFVTALDRLWADAATIFTPLAGETVLVQQQILAQPMEALLGGWLTRVAATLSPLRIEVPPQLPPPDPTTGRSVRTDEFHWLWSEFTMVARSEPGATW